MNAFKIDIPGKPFTISMTQQSTSISSGSLIVKGGIGISKDMYIGGNLSLSNTILDNVSGFGTNGSLGSMIYHNGTEYIQLQGGTNTQVLQINNSIISWVNSTAVGITSHSGLGNLTVDDHTQYLLVNGSRAMTGQLNMNFGNFDNVGGFAGVAGALGDIPIRNATEYTRLAGGTNNQILFITASVPTWTAQSSIIHSSISSLTSDDHTQYLLINGSRAMTGELDLGLGRFDNVGGFAGVAGALGDIPYRDTTQYRRLAGGTTDQILSVVASVPTWVSQSNIIHSSLTSLLTDSHTQYMNISGVRIMTGELDLGGNNFDNLAGFHVSGALGSIPFYNGVEYSQLAGATNNRILAMTGSTLAWVSKSFYQSPWTSDIDADNFRLIDITQIGTNSTAGSSSSIAMGVSADAKGISSIAIGQAAKANGLSSIAIGSSSISSGIDSIAIGPQATATNQNGIAIGYQSFSSGNGAIAIGAIAYAFGQNVICIGEGATSYSDRTINIGYLSFTNSVDAISIGAFSFSDGTDSIAIGYESVNSSPGAINIGSYSSIPETSSTYAINIGSSAYTIGIESINIGYHARAIKNRSITMGSRARSDGEGAISIGASTTSNANYAINIGMESLNTSVSTFIFSPGTTNPVIAGKSSGIVIDGCIEQSGTTSKSATATLTAAEIKAGTVLRYTGSTASQTLTLPTGTSITSRYTHFTSLTTFNVYFRNESTVSVNIAQNTNCTIQPSSPVTVTTNTGIWMRFYNSSGNNWDVYIFKGFDC